MNDNIPNSDLKIIKGNSHNVHLEKPDEFNKIVGEFLKKKMIGSILCNIFGKFNNVYKKYILKL